MITAPLPHWAAYAILVVMGAFLMALAVVGRRRGVR